jgi:hypothetical protein
MLSCYFCNNSKPQYSLNYSYKCEDCKKPDKLIDVITSYRNNLSEIYACHIYVAHNNTKYLYKYVFDEKITYLYDLTEYYTIQKTDPLITFNQIINPSNAKEKLITYLTFN